MRMKRQTVLEGIHLSMPWIRGSEPKDENCVNKMTLVRVAKNSQMFDSLIRLFFVLGVGRVCWETRFKVIIRLYVKDVKIRLCIYSDYTKVQATCLYIPRKGQIK